MDSDSTSPGLKPQEPWIPSEQDSAIRLSIPVTIILERRTISRSFWTVPSWYLHTVAVGKNLSVGEGLSSGDGVAAGKTEKGELFAWGGFEVTLYKDACERYWHALIGDSPKVYVICRDDADDNTHLMRPVSVTIDYDDASAAAETDVPVLSTQIPGELYRYMEKFVLTHYKPQEFKKRKRRNWSGERDKSATSTNGQSNSHSEGSRRE